MDLQKFIEAAYNWLIYLPWIGLLLFLSLPLALAYFAKIYPTLRWMWLLAPIAIVSLFIIKFSTVVSIVLFANVLAVATLLYDLQPLLRPCKLRVRREMNRIASLEKPHLVELEIDNESKQPWTFEVRDDYFDEMVAQPAEQKITLPAKKQSQLKYTLRTNRRGSYLMQKVYFRLHSRLGLWHRLIARPAVSELRVYPDMQQLSEYAILARTNRLSLIGVRRNRRIGQDNNFERLRDYIDGDNYRHIDWRSTARRNKLTVKQFQSDQSQRLHFMVDCGRMMTNEHQGLTLVDYAFNSMLMLSYVALRQHDSVGLTCFSDAIHDYVPSRSGGSQMNHLLHATYSRFPNFEQSRFDDAFLHLSNHCRKRSMVILITNIIDEVTATQITNYLSNLSGRHLPILALLRDHRIFDYADNPDMDDKVLHRSAAAAEILFWRHETIQKLRQRGVLVVDAFPEQLTSPLVNQYLEVKAKHLL